MVHQYPNDVARSRAITINLCDCFLSHDHRVPVFLGAIAGLNMGRLCVVANYSMIMYQEMITD